MLDTYKSLYRIAYGTYLRVETDTRRVKFIYTVDDKELDNSEMIFSFTLLSEVGETWKRLYQNWLTHYGLILEIEDTVNDDGSWYYGNKVLGDLS